MWAGNLWIYDPSLDQFLPSHGYVTRALFVLLKGCNKYGMPVSDGARSDGACFPWTAAELSSRFHSISMDSQGFIIGLLGDRSVTLLRIETQQTWQSPGKRFVIKQLWTIECNEGGLHAIAISPDSRLVAAADKGGGDMDLGNADASSTL